MEIRSVFGPSFFPELVKGVFFFVFFWISVSGWFSISELQRDRDGVPVKDFPIESGVVKFPGDSGRRPGYGSRWRPSRQTGAESTPKRGTGDEKLLFLILCRRRKRPKTGLSASAATPSAITAKERLPIKNDLVWDVFKRVFIYLFI